MEIIVILIDILFFLIIIALPFIFSNRNSNRYKMFNIFTLILSVFILTILFSWWNDFSVEFLLSNYGYDPYNSSEEGILESVGKENFERVMELRISHMGIGWPLKALFGIIPISVYSIISYFLMNYVYKTKIKNKN